MYTNHAFSLVMLLAFITAFETHAQNFEGDSIYYTPIPHPTAKKESGKHVFRDTVLHQPYVAYYFNLQAGTLIGCSDCDEAKEVTFTGSTTHGASIGKKLRAGIGIGFDSYDNWNTMPLFGSVSWDVFGTRNTDALFVQVKYGWAEAWIKDHDDVYGFKSTGGGRMSDIQLGYRIKRHHVNIAFSVGAKFQRVYSYFAYPIYSYHEGQMTDTPAITKTVQQDMTRVSVGVAIGWK